VNHLFANAAAAGVRGVWTDEQIVVAKFTPNAENLDTFGLIGFDEKVIEHGA
jgi:hypothetical protein